MRSISLRTRLVLGLLAVVAIGLGTAEVATYYSVRSFMLNRVDEQVDAAAGPAAVRLLIEDRIRGGPGSVRRDPTITTDPATGEVVSGGGLAGPGIGGRGSPPGVPQNFSASIPPGTYAEVRFVDESVPARATSFGFEDTYPVPVLSAELTATNLTATRFTASAADGAEQFRVGATRLPDGSGVLLVAVPMTEFGTTMERLQIVGTVVTVAVLAAVALLAFWLVRLGLKPLDEFAATAAHIAAGDMSQRMPVATSGTEIRRLGMAMNEMLDDLQNAFQRRDKSERQLRRFLADASHELRTPLTSIRGYAELFGRGASTRPDDLAKVMGRITQQSERMSLIVEDLLLLARLDQDRPLANEPVDLQGIAREVVEEARDREPNRGISFHTEGPAEVTGDASRLYQVVSNLVANALGHTPDSAAVEVSIRSLDRTVVVEVKDSGPGIAAEDHEHVFEPFYRSSGGRTRQDGGSGLGLAIVRAIVEAHQGSVSVINLEPHGASFRLTLPMSTGA